MKYGLRFYNREHPHGQDDSFRFTQEGRAINDAKRATRSGEAFKVEIWRVEHDHLNREFRVDTLPIRVYFGAVADGLREHVENVVPRPFSLSRR